MKGNVWSFGTEVQSQNKTIMFLTNDEFVSDKDMHFRRNSVMTTGGTGKC